jgi:uncharacterized protein with PhoU and TrkA domain
LEKRFAVIGLSEEFGMAELEATSRMVGKTLRFGVNVVAIKAQKDLKAAPAAAERIREGDVLVVCANENPRRLEREIARV